MIPARTDPLARLLEVIEDDRQTLTLTRDEIARCMAQSETPATPAQAAAAVSRFRRIASRLLGKDPPECSKR